MPRSGGVVPPFSRNEPEKPKEVRLVIDESVSISDQEAGKKKAAKNYIIIAVGVIVGALVGWAIGGTMNDRKLYNAAVVDGKSIYDGVRKASDGVAQAQSLIAAIEGAAKGGPGKAPAVDYKSIEGLVALEKPFDAAAFSRKRYQLFTPATVDSLFQYNTNVGMLWDQFATLNATTAGDARRKELDTAAQAASDLATGQTGCVLVTAEGAPPSCGLVFVAPPEDGGTKLKVSAAKGSLRTFEKSLYTGGEPTGENVILVDTKNSLGVLGQSAGAFTEYLRLVAKIKALMDETVEVQGRLEQELGKVAGLDEVFAL